MKITRRALGGLGVAAALPASQTGPQAPNILFLISDDHTYKDLGCYGNRVVRTPNLDRLAGEGVRFTNCYVSSPQCSPNRSSVFTGCAPHTTATSRLHTPMPPWESTYIEALRERGYFLGAYRKVHQGKAFDKRWDFYGDRSVLFEKFFESTPKGKPFFLHVGFTDPHRVYRKGAASPPHDPAQVEVPSFLPDVADVREDLALYHDAITRMDSECGQLFEILKQRGLHENTLVVFTGDNGMPFPRAKGTCYDPGIRVPLLARWPGKIAPASVKDELIAHVDLPATWLDVAGSPKSPKMQGRSFKGLLTGGAYEARAEVFSERNWHDNFDPLRSVRTKQHKLIFNAAPHFPYRPPSDLRDSPTWAAMLKMRGSVRMKPAIERLFEPNRPLLELYDVQADPDEFTNLATSAAHADILSDLQRRLSRWMHDTYDFLPPGIPGLGDPPGRVWPFSL